VGDLIPDLYASDIVSKGRVVNFRARWRGKKLGPFRVNTPGTHNVSNALAAMAVALELDVPSDLIRAGLAAFNGVERRFHIRGEKKGVMVLDDYGHHPTDIHEPKGCWKNSLMCFPRQIRCSLRRFILLGSSPFQVSRGRD
jgi:UDP-N-acetylmuramate--alanine ligase